MSKLRAGDGFQQPLLEDIQWGKMQTGQDRNVKEAETWASVVYLCKGLPHSSSPPPPHGHENNQVSL